MNIYKFVKRDKKGTSICEKAMTSLYLWKWTIRNLLFSEKEQKLVFLIGNEQFVFCENGHISILLNGTLLYIVINCTNRWVYL